MSIIASNIISNVVQGDGRRSIVERHTDHLGKTWDRYYVAAALFDFAAALAAYATRLVIDLRNNEITSNVEAVVTNGSLAVYTLNYSTAAQNFSALRTAYQISTKVEAIMIGDFLSSLTNAQLQNAFNMTLAEVTTLRTNKLTPAANAAATIRASTGA